MSVSLQSGDIVIHFSFLTGVWDEWRWTEDSTWRRATHSTEVWYDICTSVCTSIFITNCILRLRTAGFIWSLGDLYLSSITVCCTNEHNLSYQRQYFSVWFKRLYLNFRNIWGIIVGGQTLGCGRLWWQIGSDWPAESFVSCILSPGT